MTDSSSEEVNCCIYRVPGHMAADCSFFSFYDPTPLTRLCNNPPSREVQLLPNLLSNPPVLVM